MKCNVVNKMDVIKRKNGTKLIKDQQQQQQQQQEKNGNALTPKQEPDTNTKEVRGLAFLFFLFNMKNFYFF